MLHPRLTQRFFLLQAIEMHMAQQLNSKLQLAIVALACAFFVSANAQYIKIDTYTDDSGLSGITQQCLKFFYEST